MYVPASHQTGRGLPGLHDYELCFSCRRVGGEKKIFKHKNPYPGKMKFTISVEGLLVNKIMHLVFLTDAWVELENIF